MDDLISRQATIDAINEQINQPISNDVTAWGLMVARDCIIAKLPSAQPERKKGQWEYVDCLVGEIRFPFPMCSVCKKTSKPFIEPKFCPNCGCRMENV